MTRAPVLPEAGALSLREVVVDPELLAAHAAPTERVAWWRERVAAAWGVLA